MNFCTRGNFFQSFFWLIISGLGAFFEAQSDFVYGIFSETRFQTTTSARNAGLG